MALRNDEVRGTVFSCLFLLIFFFLWFLLLLVFKYLGSDFVDYWSGSPSARAPRDAHTVVFSVCGVIYIVCCFLALCKGFVILEEGAIFAVEVFELCLNIFDKTEELIQTVLLNETARAQREAGPLQDLIEGAIEAMAGLRDENGNLNATDAAALQNLEAVQEDLTVTEIVNATFLVVQQGIDGIQEHCHKEHRLYSLMENVLPYQIGLGIPATLTPLLLMLVVALTRRGSSTAGMLKVTRWVLLPVLAGCTFFTTMGATVFWAWAIDNADYCTGPPDNSALAVISPEEYAISGCMVSPEKQDQAISELEDFLAKVSATNLNISDMIDKLVPASLQRMALLLGFDFDVLKTALEKMQQLLTTIIEGTVIVLNNIGCGEVFDNYYDWIETTPLCIKAISGMLWTTVPFLVMSFCGFLMFTFRSVLYPVEEEDTKMAAGGSSAAEVATPLIKDAKEESGAAVGDAEEPPNDAEAEATGEPPATDPSAESTEAGATRAKPLTASEKKVLQSVTSVRTC